MCRWAGATEAYCSDRSRSRRRIPALAAMDLRGDRLRRLCGDAADFGWVRGHIDGELSRTGFEKDCKARVGISLNLLCMCRMRADVSSSHLLAHRNHLT